MKPSNIQVGIAVETFRVDEQETLHRLAREIHFPAAGAVEQVVVSGFSDPDHEAVVARFSVGVHADAHFFIDHKNQSAHHFLFQNGSAGGQAAAHPVG